MAAHTSYRSHAAPQALALAEEEEAQRRRTWAAVAAAFFAGVAVALLRRP